ncbi:sodium/hydrogen exchanger 3 isoform X17 [Wyeomyia smithii]|uniref:sodium/hydrogen exchanger 3 isoform X17 n=1 Tax=Wyeomyia smithii TaxID=174621 RepID=UPI002467B6C6|nr:sodium/hydrogen exchanger 3 isoform X17 [Wyeomyia smithii]
MVASFLQQEVNLSRRACRRLPEDNHNHHDVNPLPTGANNPTPEKSTQENVFNQQRIVNSEMASSTVATSEDLILTGNSMFSYSETRAVNEKVKSSDSYRLVFSCDFIAQILLLVKNLVMNSICNLGRLASSGRSRSSFIRGLGKVYMCVIVVSILLGDGGGLVLARPNRSNVATGEESVAAVISEHLVVDRNTPYPGMNFESLGPSESQLKRSAELASIVSSTVPSEGAAGGGGYSLGSVPKRDSGHSELASEDDGHGEGHEVNRYPVAQVEFSRVETPFVIGVWILSASIAKIGFHMTPKLSKMFPESCLLIVVGVIIGVLLRFATNLHVSPLTPNTFFFYMLPPIILDAGYFMPNRMFFDNIGTILLMAVIGTIFNIATIGVSLWACGLTGIFGVDLPFLHVFLFSSLISAVDPVAVLAVFEEIHVNEVLYIVVFGESLLNDAVTVVMYHMFESYDEIGADKIEAIDIISGAASFFVVAIGGTVIGVIWGFLTGLVTRFTDHVRVIEPIFIFVMAYLAYLNAEIFHMSGILAITFCGITMKNYVEQNVSHKSHTTIKYALKMLSSSSETIIFMFLGVATINNQHNWNTWFVVLTIVFCSVFRIIGVLILSALANRFRIHKLSKVDQFVMSYGGLRGAVAFALVLLVSKEHIPLQPMFVTTTIAVIYFTVFLQGITIKPLVRILNVKRSSKRKPTMNERIHERFMDHTMAGIEDIVGKTGNYNIRDKFKRFDNRFIRPYLIKNLQGPEPKILETYSKLTMRDAMDYMRRNPSTIGQMSGTESMSALFRNYTGVFGGRCGASFLGTCPSFSNLENSTRNLDMQELDYNPSKKDLTDARIHHLLSVELKPYRRTSTNLQNPLKTGHRRLSYSRHAVDDRDLSTQQVNYKMQMNIRRMISEKKHHKRSKRVKDGKQQNHVSFPEFAQNGSAKQFANGTNDIVMTNDTITITNHHPPPQPPSNDYNRKKNYINEVLHEDNEDEDKIATAGGDDWDGGGLTFTAKSSLDENSQPLKNDKRLSKDMKDAEESRVTTPTAIEAVLPWKRDVEDDESGAIKQNEFPSWASNKEYLAYNSPSATFLGGLTQPKQAKSVIGLFRRESSGSGGIVIGGVTDSETSTPVMATTPIGRVKKDKRSASIAGYITFDGSSGDANGDPLGVSKAAAAVPHANAFPVTASHRRNNRRGSMLELSGYNTSEFVDFTIVARRLSMKCCEAIPEENYTKSLPERDRYGARRGPTLIKASGTPRSAGSNHKSSNPQATALLSSSSTDSEEDEEEDEDCGDEQHPI